VTESFGLGDGNAEQHQGILQVDVFGKDNSGTEILLQKAEQVKALYPRGTVLEHGGVRVKIQQAPSILQAFPANGWYQIPVSIPYRVIT
jgi:hypothetical protein